MQAKIIKKFMLDITDNKFFTFNIQKKYHSFFLFLYCWSLKPAFHSHFHFFVFKIFLFLYKCIIVTIQYIFVKSNISYFIYIANNLFY